VPIAQNSDVVEEQVNNRFTEIQFMQYDERRLVVTSYSSTLHELNKVIRQRLSIIDNECFTLLAFTLLPNRVPSPHRLNVISAFSRYVTQRIYNL